MNEDALIRELKRKTLVKNRNIMVGRVFLSACLEAMTEQRAKIRRLQEALDAANREVAACKAENDRLMLENDDLKVQVDYYDRDDLQYADEEIKRLKAEVERLNRENFWLTNRGGTRGF